MGEGIFRYHNEGRYYNLGRGVLGVMKINRKKLPVLVVSMYQVLLLFFCCMNYSTAFSLFLLLLFNPSMPACSFLTATKQPNLKPSVVGSVVELTPARPKTRFQFPADQFFSFNF